MPRKRNDADYDIKFHALKEFNLFGNDDKILSWSNEIWSTAGEKLNLKPTTVYEDLRQNRGNLRSRLFQFHKENSTGENSKAEYENCVEKNESSSESGESSTESGDEENLEKDKKIEEISTVTGVLREMRSDQKFKKWIRFVGALDFYIMYWSPEQTLLFNKLFKKYIQHLELTIYQNYIEDVIIKDLKTENLKFYAINGSMKKIHIPLDK